MSSRSQTGFNERRVIFSSFKASLLALGTISLFTHSPTYATSIPESPLPIRLIINNWTSQIVMTEILGKIYHDKGYTVEYKELASKDQWAHLHRGLAHIQVEVWQGTMSEDLARTSALGQVIEAGDHDALTREEWWYPSYVEERCPGLPDWQALKKCAVLFSDSSTSPKGRYVAGPWEKPERARIRALEMDFVVKPVKVADDLWIELNKAYTEKAPIVLFNWSPNWIEDRFDGEFVEFPEYDPKCETDPTWGVNSTRLYDCGNPKNGWLKKVTWVQTEQEWPCAHAILNDMNFDNAMISQIAAYVDADGMTHTQAADKWISDNTALISTWGAETCSK
ncbi:ABC transporter substrate-binding protein [Kiloniella antarctica]|uniref:ABC transporter substrate-binding protein n=1 Tax=Kiloniella antarctica TaxID=1550907 RepID=A0ABW5BK43_9PROT